MDYEEEVKKLKEELKEIVTKITFSKKQLITMNNYEDLEKLKEDLKVIKKKLTILQINHLEEERRKK